MMLSSNPSRITTVSIRVTSVPPRLKAQERPVNEIALILPVEEALALREALGPGGGAGLV